MVNSEKQARNKQFLLTMHILQKIFSDFAGIANTLIKLTEKPAFH